MASPVIGWDIGGAHVKAVMLNAQGAVCKAMQHPCALWKGLHLLDEAVLHILQAWQLRAEDCAHAVTMTGELVDLFACREEGVLAIADSVLRLLPRASFYAASAEHAEFIVDVRGHAVHVASMNWHASAQSIAQMSSHQTLIVVDIGSTTTDVTWCEGNQVQTSGWTDAARMKFGGLLYTGVVRTPLMALGPWLNRQGKLQHVAAEYFATTADVYRVLGELPPSDDMADTADGQDKSALATMRRLARMVGHDVDDATAPVWQTLAQDFKQQQLDIMERTLQQTLVMHAQSPVLVGLGAGAFLLPALAKRLDLVYQPVQDMITAETTALQHLAGVCFPAYAVSRLWQTWH
ncbi:hydantoinase/oxoprolinase family protein [Methylophilus aquaticus]|uniref:Hydantoinase/oxoprolinase family protein n=1 Tax=Methylophilus aquaticus TaxID=1971610 RepID=A0ABT9JRC1_9PROT|nr:hydantoinase/oxoprolinase family protein [Methylophilus aquaticus]MDP8567113.1 hydantoinase/oxoprolinase family protein [Methylophilus aquaticus]